MGRGDTRITKEKFEQITSCLSTATEKKTIPKVKKKAQSKLLREEILVLAKMGDRRKECELIKRTFQTNTKQMHMTKRKNEAEGGAVPGIQGWKDEIRETCCDYIAELYNSHRKGNLDVELNKEAPDITKDKAREPLRRIITESQSAENGPGLSEDD
ncbi:hypothetical protein CAPTEDRAFT_201634 [Capitella teleta]|uniref:Uncharacterized protein n=1 Tax=Capitella teleta TaxID=283909 RepID=R7T3M8_CAPTE|nr:hypothetical protein CAPTEDRAFT_201634 [Capitella teleta]|eukprot:ELT87236.1 hypothetical protein CAPTEDRAFT_201634 [Capitella teleta]